MSERITDKIGEIEKYLDELGEIVPNSLEDYMRDFKSKAACERYAERIIGALIDLALLVIKDKGLRMPETDLQSFDILSENQLIKPGLATRLQDAKRMRNILAHQYGEVDDEIVFHAISHELTNDTRDFLRLVKPSEKREKKNSPLKETTVRAPM